MVNLNPDLAYPEPAFRSLSGYALRLEHADRAALNHLAAYIETKPTDLLSHTRRILIAIDLKDPDELFGALVDLFIAKGSTTTNVCANLLHRSAALLSAEQQNFLQQHVVNGLTAQTPVTARCSRLTAGILLGKATQALQPFGTSAA